VVTRSPWYAVPLVWIPIVSVLFYFAVRAGLSIWLVPVLILFGPFLWNFFEYQLHKHLFHMTPKTRLTRFIHFLLHGYHHVYPADRLRLTFPPAPAMAFALGIYYTCGICLLPSHYSLAIMAGIVSGYIYYDLMHYYLHHAPPKFLYTKELKTHHLYHHYKNEQANFGISMWLFDYIFDTFDPTLLQERKRKQEKAKTN